MSASWLIVIASLLFAVMGVCVKLASATYGSGEIVMYRGLVGALMIGAMSLWRGDSLRTAIPAKHFLRSLTGVTALCLWFYAIGKLPLATAMTLNYTSSLWIALFLIGGASVLRTKPVDRRLVFAALLGFAGVVLVLRPTIEQNQLWYGLVGLLSGMVSATGYLQITAMGRAGETENRIVFYFSIGGVLGGAALSTLTGWHAHSWSGTAMPARRGRARHHGAADAHARLRERPDAGQREPAIPGNRLLVLLRRAAVPRAGHLDRSGRDGADRRRGRSCNAAARARWRCHQPRAEQGLSNLYFFAHAGGHRLLNRADPLRESRFSLHLTPAPFDAFREYRPACPRSLI
ncbi:MAG: DMT family transporter [Burkholderiaceae bacterium]